MNISTDKYIYWMQKFTDSTVKNLTDTKEKVKITAVSSAIGLKELGWNANYSYVKNNFNGNRAAYHNHLAHVKYSSGNKTIRKWDAWQAREADSYYRYYSEYRYHKYTITTYIKSPTGAYVKSNGTYIKYDKTKHKNKQRYKKKVTDYQFKTRKHLKKEIKGYTGDKLYFAIPKGWSTDSSSIPQPTRFEIAYSDYEKGGSGVSRNSNGEAYRNRKQKNLRTISVEFNGLTEIQYRKVLSYVSSLYIKMKFYDPMIAGGETTSKFFCETKSIGAKENGRWEGLTFSLVEAERQDYD